MIVNRFRAAVLLLGVMTSGLGLAARHQLSLPMLTNAMPSQDKKQLVDDKTIRDLIKQLGDDSYDTREAAEKRLAAIGETALTLLQKAAKDDPDAEVRLRSQQLITGMKAKLFFAVHQLTGHETERQKKATCVVVTPDGSLAISAGSEKLRSWDLKTGKEVLVFGSLNKPAFWSLAISADGKRVLAGAEDQIARLYEVVTGKELQTFIGHTGTVWGVAWLPGEKEILTGSWDESIRVWDVATGKQVRAFEGVRGRIRCLVLSPDGKMAATGNLPQKDGVGTVHLWDVASGKEIRAFVGHTDEATSVAFSADAKTLLTAGHDGTIRLWDVATGKETKRLTQPPHRVETAAFTSDGRRIIACGASSSTVRVWDVATGKVLFESPEVGGGFLFAAPLPDGSHCISASRDGIIRLWHWTK